MVLVVDDDDSSQHGPGTVLSVVLTLTLKLDLTASSSRRYYYCPHFKDGDVETQGGLADRSKS